MELHGIHHITAITADAQANVDFYAGVLGLRLVKKTVNFDSPDVYHLYYGDEIGTPGTILTFFEFPQAARGRHGDGMVHTIQWRVGDLEHWAARLERAGVAFERGPDRLGFTDPEGLGIELLAGGEGTQLGSFHGARAYASGPEDSAGLLQAIGFTGSGSRWELAGARWTYEPAPPAAGVQGAGTIHHIAWAMADEDEAAWGAVVRRAGAHPTTVIDRTYFHSVYFREPSGILFELATLSPGFTVDEPAETLGEALLLPPQHEHLRPLLERTLTPLTVPTAVTS